MGMKKDKFNCFKCRKVNYLEHDGRIAKYSIVCPKCESKYTAHVRENDILYVSGNKEKVVENVWKINTMWKMLT